MNEGSEAILWAARRNAALVVVLAVDASRDFARVSEFEASASLVSRDAREHCRCLSEQLAYYTLEKLELLRVYCPGVGRSGVGQGCVSFRYRLAFVCETLVALKCSHTIRCTRVKQEGRAHANDVEEASGRSTGGGGVEPSAVPGADVSTEAPTEVTRSPLRSGDEGRTDPMSSSKISTGAQATIGSRDTGDWAR